MKKIMITGMILIVACVTFLGCSNTMLNANGLEEIVTLGDFIQYDYTELKENAKIIAEVEIEDELAKENSHFLYSNDIYNQCIGYYSIRNAKILNLYKGDEYTSKGDVIEILDNAAVTDSAYYHRDGYTELKKGNTYIVYLNNDTASGQFSIMSCSNGVVDLSKISESEYYDIAIKSIVEFKSDLSEREKATILSIPHIEKGEEIVSELDGVETFIVKLDNGKSEETLTFTYNADKGAIACFPK